VILATVLVFAAIHLPSVPLAVVAGFMVGATCFVYFRAGNLPAAGLFHGAVATFAYFFVLGEDPLGRLVQAGIWP
jgi:membrane protease YdiL (CAAX protease family)